jgi:hypothetical protein
MLAQLPMEVIPDLSCALHRPDRLADSPPR